MPDKLLDLMLSRAAAYPSIRPKIKQEMVDVGPDLPQVPKPPPIATVDPHVVGSPELGKLVKLLINRAPNLRPAINRVSQRPLIEEEEMTFGRYNNDKTIDLGVSLEKEPQHMWDREGTFTIPSLLQTLIHEAAHAVGHDEYDSRQFENMVTEPISNRIYDKINRNKSGQD